MAAHGSKRVIRPYRSLRGTVRLIQWACPSALRAPGASLRLSELVPDKFVEPQGFVHHLSPPDTQNAPSMRHAIVWSLRGIVRPIHGPHPSALRAPGPACGCPILFQTKLSNRKGSSTTSLRQIRKTPLAGRFAYLAEREGFEPSIRLLTLYSLSRGAPSATRASLRGFFALLRSRQGYRPTRTR